MTIRVYDYKCPDCGQIQEHFLKRDEVPDKMPCPSCSGTMDRLIPAPRPTLDGITGDFPSAADAWANKHEQGARIAAKKNRDKRVYESQQE